MDLSVLFLDYSSQFSWLLLPDAIDGDGDGDITKEEFINNAGKSEFIKGLLGEDDPEDQ